MDEDLLNSIEEISMGSSEPGRRIDVTFGSRPKDPIEESISSLSNTPSSKLSHHDTPHFNRPYVSREPHTPRESHESHKPHKSHHKSVKPTTAILTLVAIASLICAGVFAWLYFEQINKPV